MSGPTRDDAKQRVLSVAGDLFAEHGFEDVTMADIAVAAGVARATVFNYFGSKYALVEAMTVGVLDAYVALLDAAIADETTPTAALIEGLGEQMGLGIESERAFFRGVFRDIGRVRLGLQEGEAVQAANQQIRDALLRLIQRGQARGELSQAFTAETLADAFHSLTNGTITDWLYQDATRPLVERMRDAVDVFLCPIATSPPNRQPEGGTG
jgi:AcrR family transcriptional regulator